MVNTGARAEHIFRVVEYIQIVDMHIQAFGYFGRQGIGNVNQFFLNPLTVSSLTHLSGGNAIAFFSMIR